VNQLIKNIFPKKIRICEKETIDQLFSSRKKVFSSNFMVCSQPGRYPYPRFVLILSKKKFGEPSIGTV